MNEQADLFSQSCSIFRNFLSQLKNLSEDEIHIEVSKIKDLELSGDKIERFIIDQLDSTFLTPLDREDIHSIAVGLDNSLDTVNSITQKIEIFKIKDASEFQAKNILLVDDVLTSGATASEASLALKQAGANKVFVLTVAS